MIYNTRFAQNVKRVFGEFYVATVNFSALKVSPFG